MLIAHLPAGYILGTFARNRWPGRSGIMAAALLGSVVPDLDMVYFHFVDGGRTHHHAYVTHWPLFWAAVGLVALSVAKWRDPRYLAPRRRLLCRRNDTYDPGQRGVAYHVANAVRPARARTRHGPGDVSQLGHELHVALDFCPRTSDMRLGAGPRISTIAARRGHA